MNARLVPKLLIVMLLVPIAASFAQSVYSVSVYAGGVSYEHDWTIGSLAHRYGLSQESRWEDSRSLVIIDVGHEAERGGIHKTYTMIHFDSRSFQVGLPAWLVAIIGLLGIALLPLLALILVRKTGRRGL